MKLEKIIKKTIPAIALTACLTGCSEKPINYSEIKLNGFPSNNYELTSMDIPTKGKILYLENTGKLNRTETDSTLTYEGQIKYRIQPDRKFAPKDNLHSDMNGNTPYGNEENWNDYWTSEREGKLTFKLK